MDDWLRDYAFPTEVVIGAPTWRRQWNLRESRVGVAEMNHAFDAWALYSEDADAPWVVRVDVHLDGHAPQSYACVRTWSRSLAAWSEIDRLTGARIECWNPATMRGNRPAGASLFVLTVIDRLATATLVLDGRECAVLSVSGPTVRPIEPAERS